MGYMCKNCGLVRRDIVKNEACNVCLKSGVKNPKNWISLKF